MSIHKKKSKQSSNILFARTGRKIESNAISDIVTRKNTYELGAAPRDNYSRDNERVRAVIDNAIRRSAK